jgi:hypothetical protein
MAYKQMAVALSMIVVPLPVSAEPPEPAPMAAAPAAGPGAKYCLRVDPFTGSRIETIKCWTREKWADQGVDVDKEWAKEGVRVIA